MKRDGKWSICKINITDETPRPNGQIYGPAMIISTIERTMALEMTEIRMKEMKARCLRVGGSCGQRNYHNKQDQHSHHKGKMDTL